jgi:hypothetical protein
MDWGPEYAYRPTIINLGLNASIVPTPHLKRKLSHSNDIEASTAPGRIGTTGEFRISVQDVLSIINAKTGAFL